MINILAMLLVYGIFIEEMRISSYRDRLKQEKKNRKWDKEWAEWSEMDKKLSIDLARCDERLKISNEQFRKQFHKKCDEFQEQCNEFNKQCEEINKKYEVK